MPIRWTKHWLNIDHSNALNNFIETDFKDLIWPNRLRIATAVMKVVFYGQQKTIKRNSPINELNF